MKIALTTHIDTLEEVRLVTLELVSLLLDNFRAGERNGHLSYKNTVRGSPVTANATKRLSVIDHVYDNDLLCLASTLLRDQI